MHCIFEGLISYHFRDILGLTSANVKETQALLPALEYTFAVVNIEGNSHLLEKVQLLDKEITQVESIGHALCQHVGDGAEEQEKGLEDLHHRLIVTTGCRVRSGRLTRTSRGVDKHLCSESGARLDSQAGDKMY